MSMMNSWLAPGFVANGQALRFGHYTADGTVIWNTMLTLEGSSPKYIHLERGPTPNIPTVIFNQNFGNAGYPTSLVILGDGRMDYPALGGAVNLNSLHITGAELRINGGSTIDYGWFAQANDIFLENGGGLILGGDSPIGKKRIAKNKTVSFRSGVLTNMDLSYSQNLGRAIIESGANDIYTFNGPIEFTGLSKNPYTTLNFSPNTVDFSQPRLSFYQWSDSDSGVINGILPWGTASGVGFITPVPINGVTALRPLATYHTNTNQNTWDSSRNLSLNSAQTLSGSRTINSLRLTTSHLLRVDNHTLTINSGGLLTYTGNPSIFGSSTGTIKTGSNNPIYAHIYSTSLKIYGSAGLDVPSLIKTGPGTLIFESGKTQKFPNLYIHQGTVEIRNPSTIQASNIYIGDGAGRDVLILPANRIDPLIDKPNITLRGTPYGLDPSHVYGGAESDQAILRLSGNTKQHIGELQIRDRGTIDFAGGEAGLANILWIDELIIVGGGVLANAKAQLFIRNWYQYEDYLLIRRSWFNSQDATRRAQLLSQIIFDGYQDFPVLAIDYDSQYYQITPFHAPEPATYGAILGAVGIGLVVWRKRKRRIESVK